MTNRLEQILSQKKREVDALYTRLANDHEHPILNLVKQGNPIAKTRFSSNLARPKLSVIAEIKRQSPSKGALAEIANPILLADEYLAGEADAISVLTDAHFFGGSLHDLEQIASLLRNKRQATLRKDFIIDPIQIAEAAIAGADAVLLIVAALQQETKSLLGTAKHMGIEVLVEVHDTRELDIALECGAEIIGVNNRNLSTFQIDTSLALQLIEKIPDSVIRVAESGILHPELAQEYRQAGYDAVLIGEALVRSQNPADFIRACHEC